MNEFKCSFCGNRHPIYWDIVEANLESILPFSDKLFKTKVFEYEDYFFLIEKKYILIRAFLRIKVNDAHTQMNWVVWVKLAPDDFFLAAENHSPNVNGTIFCDPPFYEGIKNTKVILTFDYGAKINYPEIETILSNGELKKDFATGITKEKVINWMEQLIHSDSRATPPLAE